MPTCRSWKMSIERLIWRSYKVRSLVSNSIYAKECQCQQTSPDAAMPFAPIRCTYPPPLSHPFCWSRTTSKRHCQKWHHEAETLITFIGTMGPKGLNVNTKGNTTALVCATKVASYQHVHNWNVHEFGRDLNLKVQWNLWIKDTLGAELLSSFRRLSFGGRFEPTCNL